MSGQPRSYLDPWDIENYIYLRTGPVRRRSVCFDTAVRYASYDESLEPGTSCSVGDLKSYGWTYSSLPLHCPSCVSTPSHNRDYERIAYEEPVYEDVTRMGVNTFGHLRIDYSNNWNKLDRYIGRA